MKSKKPVQKPSKHQSYLPQHIKKETKRIPVQNPFFIGRSSESLLLISQISNVWRLSSVLSHLLGWLNWLLVEADLHLIFLLLLVRYSMCED